MNEKDTIRDLGELKTRFDKAGKPLLPPSLSSEELFRQVDADRLRLEHGDVTPEKTGKVLRFPARTAAIAAAVLLVVGAFAAGHRILFSDDTGPAAVSSYHSEDPAARERHDLPGEPEPGVTALPPEAELPEAGAIAALLESAVWETDDLKGAPKAADFVLNGTDYAIDRETGVLYNLTEGRAAQLTAKEREHLTALLG